MTDLYALFGVSNQASQQEIRQRYRRLAFQFHPDKNPGDPAAETKFKILNEAYQILSDPEKRSSYDAAYAYWLHSLMHPEQAQAEPEPTPESRRGAPAAETPFRPGPPAGVSRLIWISVGSTLLFMLFAVFFFRLMERVTANNMLQEAIQLAGDGNKANAMAMARTAIKKNPDLAHAHYFIARLKAESKQYEEAAEWAGLAIAKSEEVKLVYHLFRGEMFQEAGEYERAIEELTKAYEAAVFTPPYSAALRLGDIYLYRRMDSQQALRWYTLASTQDSLREEALIGLAVSHIREQEYTKSLVSLEQLRQINAQHPIGYYYRAECHLHLGDTARACYLWSYAFAGGVRESAIRIRAYCEQE